MLVSNPAKNSKNSLNGQNRCTVYLLGNLSSMAVHRRNLNSADKSLISWVNKFWNAENKFKEYSPLFSRRYTCDKAQVRCSCLI